jgi:hypothetical protein
VRRQVLLDDVVRLLERARDSRLEVLRQFLQLPAARVFLPRSAHGPALFSRLVDLDVLLSRAETRLMRDSDPMRAFDARSRLERDICQLHILLIELCAGLAATYDLEPTDPAVIDALRRLRARADQVPEPIEGKEALRSSVAVPR